MRNGITRQTHTPQDENGTDRPTSQANGKASHQRASHKVILNERLKEPRIRQYKPIKHHQRTIPTSLGRAHQGARSSQYSDVCRARARFSGASACALSPQAMTSRANNSVCGKCARTIFMSCNTAITVRACRCQVSTTCNKSSAVSVSKQNDWCVLHQQPGKQHPLQLANGQFTDQATFKPNQTYRSQGFSGMHAHQCCDAIKAF